VSKKHPAAAARRPGRTAKKAVSAPPKIRPAAFQTHKSREKRRRGGFFCAAP